MVGKKRKLKSVIFDLDGVLVDTVPLHFKSWRKIFLEYGRKFTFQDYKEKVDGISRLEGARAILHDLNLKELEKAADIKNRYYLEYIKKIGVRVYQTSLDLIRELKANNIKIAVISASKNCDLILRKTNLFKEFDVKVGGNDVKKGKPDPEIFLVALKMLHSKKNECIVFEDAYCGVLAAKKAGIFTIGVDRYNYAKRLEKADRVVSDLGQINCSQLKKLLEG